MPRRIRWFTAYPDVSPLCSRDTTGAPWGTGHRRVSQDPPSHPTMTTIRIAAHVDVRYTTRRPTGVDKHIARMVRGLAITPGFEVTVVASRGQLPDGRLPAESSLAGLPVRPLPLSHRFGRAWWSISPVPGIDRFCPGVDWVWSPQELWAPTRRARTAVTIHGCTYFERSFPAYRSLWARMERRRLGWFFARVCRHADMVLPVSAYLERFLIERFGLDPKRSLVVGNGVDDVFFAAGEAAVKTGSYDRDRLLVVGGLNAWDGGERVLACAEELARRAPEMVIDVVGTMDERRNVRRCGRLPNVKRIGFRSPVDLAAMMPGYLALLYLPNVESFGIVLLEAMAAGLPVIACRLTAVPETAGTAARYVDEDRPRDVIDAVESLRASPDERAAWVRRGRRHAVGHTWKACVDRLARAFTETVPQRIPPTEPVSERYAR